MLSEETIKAASLILKVGDESQGKIKFSTLTGDASDRSYFRVSNIPGSKKTFVLMKMKKGFNSPAEEITKTKSTIDELPFINVQRFLKNAGTPVPGIIGFDAEDGIILLEDLGDDSLYSLLESMPEKKKLSIYGRLIDEMIGFQTAEDGRNGCVAFFRRYDREMCIWELNHFVEWGIESLLGRHFKESEKRSVESLFFSVTDTFLNEPFVFSHRDYHSKNVMMPGGEIKIIDFQDAILAPCQYDLASLLKDSYTDLGDDFEEKMIKKYADGFHPGGWKGFSPDKFRFAYDSVGLQRNFKAAGRFVFILRKKNNANYLRHIPRTLGHMRKTLSRHPEFSGAKEILFPYFTSIEEKIAAMEGSV